MIVAVAIVTTLLLGTKDAGASATTELFSGRLTTAVAEHSFASGAGTASATLKVTKAPSATLQLVGPDGATLASASTTNGVAKLRADLRVAGVYRVQVQGSGAWKGAARYEVQVDHAVATETTTTAAPTTATTAATSTTTSTTSPTSTTQPTWSPRVFDIPTSIAADCSVDVTAALNAWIASVPDGTATAPNTLRFGAGRCYRVDGMLVNPRQATATPERRYLVFDGNGATLDGRYFNVPAATATKINHSMWMFEHAQGVTVANFTMYGQHPNPCNLDGAGNCRDGGAVGAYEWFAGVAFEGGRDLAVRNNRIHGMYGDGVSIAQGDNCWQGANVWGADHPTNVLVEGNLIDGTGRHGIALTGGVGVRIVGNTFDRISYHVADLEYECSQPIRDVTFDRNTVRRHYLGFIASITGGEAGLCPPEGFNGGYVVTNNVMEVSGVTTTPPIWVTSTQVGVCSAYDKADVRIEGNTLRYAHAEGTNSAVQIDTTAGTIAVRANRIIQPGTAPAVKLTRLRASAAVQNNDMRESAWAYSLDGVQHAPAVAACGNVTTSSASTPTGC